MVLHTRGRILSGNGMGGMAVTETVTQRRLRVERVLKPLKDVVLALQMNSRYLPDFVQSELYEDFGAGNSVKVWQLLMYWRNESKEEILRVYEECFSQWVSDQSGSGGRTGSGTVPFLEIAYISKVKAASVITVISVKR
jgi:hypothetical protein